MKHVAVMISYPAGRPPISWDSDLENAISWELYHSVGRHVASWDIEEDRWLTVVNITEKQRKLLASCIKIAFQNYVQVS